LTIGFVKKKSDGNNFIIHKLKIKITNEHELFYLYKNDYHFMDNIIMIKYFMYNIKINKINNKRFFL